MRTFSRFMLGFIGIALASLALAGEFTSKRGYSLTYPDGWEIATREACDMTERVAEKLLNKSGQEIKVAINTLIVNPEKKSFSDNINVVVSGSTVPVTPEAEKEIVRQVRNGFEGMGWTIQKMESKRTQLAKMNVISIQTEVAIPNAPVPMKQWQVVFPGKTRAYIVTCSSSVEEFPKMESAFRAALDSVKIDVGVDTEKTKPTGAKSKTAKPKTAKN